MTATHEADGPPFVAHNLCLDWNAAMPVLKAMLARDKPFAEHTFVDDLATEMRREGFQIENDHDVWEFLLPESVILAAAQVLKEEVNA